MSISKQSLSLSIPLGLLLAVLVVPAQAEHRVDGKRIYDHLTNPSLNVEKKGSGGDKERSRQELHFKHMEKAPSELPGMVLPGESQGKFAYGLQKPQGNNTTIYLQYKMKQPKDYVMAQYREHLKAGGWTLNQSRNPDQLMAALRGNSVTIQTMKYGNTYQSSLAIFYVLKNQ